MVRVTSHFRLCWACVKTIDVNAFHFGCTTITVINQRALTSQLSGMSERKIETVLIECSSRKWPIAIEIRDEDVWHKEVLNDCSSRFVLEMSLRSIVWTKETEKDLLFFHRSSSQNWFSFRRVLRLIVHHQQQSEGKKKQEGESGHSAVSHPPSVCEEWREKEGERERKREEA